MGPAALLREEVGLLSQPYWQSHTCHLSQDTTGQGLAHQHESCICSWVDSWEDVRLVYQNTDLFHHRTQS